VRQVTADGRPDAVVAGIEPWVVEGRTGAYIVRLAGGGYCLCGADDLVLPVYLYNPAGECDLAIPDYRWILDSIARRTARLRQALAANDASVQPYQATLTVRAGDWKELIAGRAPTSRQIVLSGSSPTSMTLPVTSFWHQDSPYNDNCPLLTPPDERAKVGCVATALSQILYYWKWPWSGTGSHSVLYYYRYRNTWDSQGLSFDPGIPAGWEDRLAWTADGGGTLWMNGWWDSSVYNGAVGISQNAGYRTALETLYNRLTQSTTNCYADYGASSYNWWLMRDSAGDPPDTAAAEIAKLCYQVGIGVNMYYGSWESTANGDGVVYALENHLRYDPDAVTAWAVSSESELLTEEIQWLRPVQLGGCDGGCHHWVVCGYNKAYDPYRQFLMNLGWGGGSTEWYSLDDVFPDDQAHVRYIAPADVVKFVGGGAGGDGSPAQPYQNIEQAIQNAPSGATLIFKAGSINTFSASPLVISRACTLKGFDVSIRK
jgi:hypothetical protein